MNERTALSGIRALLSLLAAGFTHLFGSWDMLLTALAAMAAADYITGLAAAGMEGALDSRIGWRGIFRKLLIFVAVGTAAALDTVTGMTGHPLRAMACLFYIGNEGISIVENLGRAGVPIPAPLASLFRRLRDENDREGKE